MYSLTPLTESGRYGRGGSAAYHLGRWGFEGYYTRDRFVSDPAQQTGFSASYFSDPRSRLSASYLRNKGDSFFFDAFDGLFVDNDGSTDTATERRLDGSSANIFSLRQQLAWAPKLNIDIEAATQRGRDEQRQRHPFDDRYALRYRAILIHADPDFRGYYQDQALGFLGFDYFPTELGGARQLPEADQQPETRSLRTAPDQQQALIGTDYHLSRRPSPWQKALKSAVWVRSRCSDSR